tara:strand:+ start:506 stop:994 length:489 start_codon:yes stop_codon:yes gene_type:complete
LVKASALVIYVLPIVLSVSLGTAVMADTLSASDRELNFMQFGGKDSGIISSSPSSTNQISIIGYSTEISKNSKIEFNVKISNSDFNCGDLYITIYDITNSEKQVLTQSGFLKQCFVQNNNTLPIGETYSEVISESGTYEIYVEMFDKKYSKNISISENLLVK